MTKLVKSPGGDAIEVIPDSEFIEVFETNDHDLRQWARRSYIFITLWRHGAYRDVSGRATAHMTANARKLGRTASPAAFNSMCQSSPTVAACIERDINGKRTHRIQLVRLPERYYNNLLATTKPKAQEVAGLIINDDVSLTFNPEPKPELDPIQMPPFDREPQLVPEPAPAFDSMAVAQHLLSLVIDKINEPTPEPVVIEPSPNMKMLAGRLAEQVEYGQRMREEARKISVRLSEVTVERDQLAKELQVLRTRFDQALTTSQRNDIDSQLRRLMEGRPSSKGE